MPNYQIDFFSSFFRKIQFEFKNGRVWIWERSKFKGDILFFVPWDFELNIWEEHKLKLYICLQFEFLKSKQSSKFKGVQFILK